MGIPPPPKHKGLFHAEKPPMDMSSFTSDMSNLGRRLRIIEERSTNLRRALQVTEQNMLAKNKLFSTEIRTITSDIKDIKKDINDVKEKVLEMVKELQESAKKGEVKVLEKYINMWNPVKFVTQNEVEAMVKDFVQQEKAKYVK